MLAGVLIDWPAEFVQVPLLAGVGVGDGVGVGVGAGVGDGVALGVAPAATANWALLLHALVPKEFVAFTNQPQLPADSALGELNEHVA